MSRGNEGPGRELLASWQRWSRLPGGRRVFSWLAGRRAPYTGSVGAVIEELRPGYARAVLRDRPRVRNHLRSVHAVALANVGEFVSGLAMLTALPATHRGIVTGLSIQYFKKARGTLTAESRASLPAVSADTTIELAADVRDAAGDVVAHLVAHWRVGPRPGESLGSVRERAT